MGEPALPSCTFMSAADEPLPVLDVGDVRLFSHEFEDEFLQTPPAPAIELSPASDLFCGKKGKIMQLNCEKFLTFDYKIENSRLKIKSIKIVYCLVT